MSATTSTNGIHTNGGKGDDKLEAIIVHCVPRSTSTAFERAFMQRADTITFHEPSQFPGPSFKLEIGCRQ